MFCELDKTEDKTCILQSPLIPDTFDWTCLYVSYQLSSDDVKMTLDLLADDESIDSYTLLANESLIQIPNLDLESSISFQLAASRYLVSTKDYEYALVTSVKFFPCTTDTGRFLYLRSNLKQINEFTEKKFAEVIYETLPEKMSPNIQSG